MGRKARKAEAEEHLLLAIGDIGLKLSKVRTLLSQRFSSIRLGTREFERTFPRMNDAEDFLFAAQQSLRRARLALMLVKWPIRNGKG